MPEGQRYHFLATQFVLLHFLCLLPLVDGDQFDVKDEGLLSPNEIKNQAHKQDDTRQYRQPIKGQHHRKSPDQHYN
jgi:hypothetical protein